MNEVSQHPLHKLFSAIQEENIDALKKAIEEGADVNSSYSPPLIKAIHTGNIDIIRCLLDNKADLNKKKNDKPLWIEALGQIQNKATELAVTAFLIENGADIEFELPPFKETILIKKCREKEVDFAKLLLEKGANGNAIDEDGNTALIKVSFLFLKEGGESKEIEEIITHLIDNKVDLNIVNQKGYTALMLLAKAGNSELVEFLLKNGAKANLQDYSDEKFSALMHASYHGHTKVIDVLKRHGAEETDARAAKCEFLENYAKESWEKVIEIALNLKEHSKDDWTLYFRTSLAHTNIGNKDEAIKWAEEGISCSFHDKLLLRLIYALVTAGKSTKAIEIWKTYKDRLIMEKSSPYILSNVISAYCIAGKIQKAIREVAPLIDSVILSDGLGLLYFNACCLYALDGDLKNALKYMYLSRKHNFQASSFETDSDLENIRNFKYFPTLLHLIPDVKLSLSKGFKTENREENYFVEIILDGNIYKKITWNKNSELNEITEHEFESELEAFLYYIKRENYLEKLCYDTHTTPYEKEIVSHLKDAYVKFGNEQKNGNIGTLTEIVVSFDEDTPEVFDFIAKDEDNESVTHTIQKEKSQNYTITSRESFKRIVSISVGYKEFRNLKTDQRIKFQYFSEGAMFKWHSENKE